MKQSMYQIAYAVRWIMSMCY